MASIPCYSYNFWNYLSEYFFAQYTYCDWFVMGIIFYLFFASLVIFILILIASGLGYKFSKNDKPYKQTLKNIMKYSMYGIIIFIIFFIIFALIPTFKKIGNQNDAKELKIDFDGKSF